MRWAVAMGISPTTVTMAPGIFRCTATVANDHDDCNDSGDAAEEDHYDNDEQANAVAAIAKLNMLVSMKYLECISEA